MSRYRHIVDGTIQFGLPDDPKERAEAFGRLAQAWSRMLSEVDDLVTEAREPTRLVGRALMKTPQEADADARCAAERRTQQMLAPGPVTFTYPPPQARQKPAPRKRGPGKKPRKRQAFSPRLKLTPDPMLEPEVEAAIGYTVKQVAKRLNSCRSTVYRLLDRNALQAVKRGSSTLVTADSLKQYISQLPSFGGNDSKGDDPHPL